MLQISMRIYKPKHCQNYTIYIQQGKLKIQSMCYYYTPPVQPIASFNEKSYINIANL